MNAEGKLIDRIYYSKGKLDTFAFCETDIVANQIAIMEYLQYLGKTINQNTNQIEFVVEKVQDISECDVVVIEEDTKD